MNQTFSIILIGATAALLAGCSPEERAADHECISKSESLFDVTADSDFLTWQRIVTACNKKVNMYFDGWNVDPYLSRRDLNIELYGFMHDRPNALREYYRDKLLTGK